MRRVLRGGAIALGVLAFVIQFVRPARTNPAGDHAGSLATVRPMPARVAAIFDRSCRDCHSNETRWPWYSNVAPISWFVIDHVNHGRRHFNSSDWRRHEAVQAAGLMKNACELARAGKMPLRSYLLIHREARLSSEDIDALCSWTEDVRRVYASVDPSRGGG